MTLSQLRVLYEVFDTRYRVKLAIRSIKLDYVEFDEIEKNNFFWQGDFIYSDENYVVTNDGNAIPRDDSFFCDELDDYVHMDDVVTAIIGRNEELVSEEYARRNLTRFNGNYYDDDALERHEIVYIEDIGGYGYMDNAYWHDDEGEWYSYPSEEFVRGYHNGSYQTLDFDNKSKYKIGYEIEKEDECIRNSIDIDDFENETDHIWRKEKDGSLDSDSGYELISPTFEFNIDKIFEHIEDNEQLVAHINAGTSTSCGGHIHLSESGLSGEELFEKIKGYTPLFYALYYGRVDKNYSKAKSNRDLQNENEKYQAIKIHHDRVEFRIISAVPNVKTLKWRSKLLMMILQNPTNDIIKAYYNVDTKFTKLLKQTYSDEKLLEVKNRFVKYTRQFEGLIVNQTKLTI
jgi:hypothetical protein